MLILLNKDHTYIIKKKPKIADRHIPNTQYILVDTSTSLKGNTFSLVDAAKIIPNKSSDPMVLGIEMDISYAAVDTPCCDATTIHQDIPISNKFSKKYSVYPLIRQLFEFNFYKDNFEVLDNLIDIDTISLITENSNVVFDREDLENDIKEEFKKRRMLTCVEDALGTNHLILADGKWSISKDIPYDFEYIAYNMPGVETLYLLTEKQLNRLEKMHSLKIEIFNRTDYTALYNITYDELDILSESGDNRIVCNDLPSILETCMFFPQLIELEKLIYHKDIAVKITITTKHRNIELYISEDETAEKGICLFNIINKLLTM